MTLVEVVNLVPTGGIEWDNDGNVEEVEGGDEDEDGQQRQQRYEPPDAEVSVYEDKWILADADFDDN